MSSRLQSAVGLIAFLVIAWVLSEDRRKLPLRTILWGLALQFLLATFILHTAVGQIGFNGFQSLVERFVGFSGEGARLLFGPLADNRLLAEKFGPANGMIFAITITSIIIFVSTVSALLYHWGILQKVVRAAAWVMRKAMRTSGSETLSAAANIFMGQTEAPLLVRPYLARMTRSELFAIMVGGMATIAASVLGAYVSFGISAGHLLTASVLSAPAGLLVAKIMLPESEVSDTAAGASAKVERQSVNSLDAACRGASEGMQLSLNVAAMLIAFVSLVALVNWVVSAGLGKLGFRHDQPLQLFLGWINAPMAWLMGIPMKDCRTIGAILGERIVLNEFLAYLSLTKVKAGLDERSVILTTYALCGFANLGSIAIQIGGIGSMAPNRRTDLASLGWRSMIGGLIACYITACIAGILG